MDVLVVDDEPLVRNIVADDLTHDGLDLAEAPSAEDALALAARAGPPEVAATDMGLGGCAIGTNNIDLFEKMTGIDFHVEGPVGQFALGRGGKPADSD